MSNPKQRNADEVIKREIKERSGVLDLHYCGISEVPSIIQEMNWLKVLNLGSDECWDKSKSKWHSFSQDKRLFHNPIKVLPNWFEELKELEQLNLDSTEVSDLSSLQRMPKLKLLYCDIKTLDNLDQICTLTSLQELSLTSVRVNDWSPLISLPKLTKLFCQSNGITSLTSLGQLTQIEILHLSSNPISDLGPLHSLSQLRKLCLYETKVEDLAPLSRMEQLEELNCGNTSVSDLSPLRSLKNLRKLYLFETKVSDLTPLREMKKLEVLNANSTLVSNISSLSALTNLRQLYLFKTLVSDLSPLRLLTLLRELDLGESKAENLGELSNIAQLEVLNIGNTSVSDIIPLRLLVCMRELYLHETKVSDLTALSDMVELEVLNCRKTLVSDLSPLKNLIVLRQLYLQDNGVENLSPLSDMRQLEVLNVGNTSVTNITQLRFLFCMRKLYLNGTKVSDLTALRDMLQLESLQCGNTIVNDLSPLKTLKNLKIIWFYGTNVADLSILSELPRLEVIDLDTTLISDLNPLRSLSELYSFECRDSKVKDLTPLGKLKKLSYLACDSTLVSDLHPMREHIRKSHFNISSRACPLVSPPIEFAESGNKAINEYFDQVGIDSEPLNQIKVIFLGDGGAGKTSLIKRLRNQVFDESEGQTHGIQIHSVDFNTDFDSISARLWDFGGQEVMHATHQFFLSQRCIYVLLLNSRTDEKAEYWLKHANSFGGNSPVLVVLNKIDENPSFEVDRKRLSSKYKQIKGFHRISCKTDEGLSELQEALREQFLLSDTRRTPFPTTWSAVKNHFLDMQDTFIDSSEFRKVCQALGVDKKFSQDVLLQFLHDLGIVINFKKLKQFDTQILDPIWLTNGVYRIINSPLVTENKGLLQESEFDDVISKSELSTNPDGTKYQYPPSKQLYIVRVMQEFELCFPLNHEQYIVPQLLPVQEADFEFEGATLHFIINFPEFLPDSIFIRLMVKLHDYIKDDLRWRSGMILSKPLVFDAVARVRADKEDRKIEIDVCGKEPRRFLKFIRVTLQEIIDDFPQLNYEEMVPLPNTDELVPYLRLVGMEEAGVEHHFVLDTKENIKVSSLLDGIEDSEMRSEANQTIVNAFISYSHEDKEHLKELRKALSPLERLNKLEIWDDRSIDGGDDWESEIFQKLRDSDIVLCLVSASFIKSDFCHERELEQALKDHQSGKQIVVPIQLRECNWDSLPIAKLQGLPGDWIQNSDNTDRALTLVSKELEEIIHKIQEKRVRAKHGIGNPSHSGREEGGQ